MVHKHVEQARTVCASAHKAQKIAMVCSSRPQATFLLIAPFSPKSQRVSTAIALVPTSQTAVEVNFSRYQRCYKVTTTPQAGETSVSHISGTWRGFQPHVARTCLLGADGHPPKHKAT